MDEARIAELERRLARIEQDDQRDRLSLLMERLRDLEAVVEDIRHDRLPPLIERIADLAATVDRLAASNVFPCLKAGAFRQMEVDVPTRK
jgi:uncharacterized coiled-coil protein SlyX